MARPAQVLRWQQIVSTYLPHLSRPQVTVLALWSLGLILAHSCDLTTVATVLAYLLARSERTTREQLRDWYREAPAKHGAKRGRKRRTLDVATCFPSLLRWVVAWWDPACPQLALAMDASTLGQRFTILTIRVVVRGCAIPVAWNVVEATRTGAWRPHGITLFEALDGCIPADWTVLVLADRGLYARWDVGYRAPGLVLTALPPRAADVVWYGLRAWIECGFKDSKRGGWQWHQTKLTHPARAERLWLVIAVATLWTVRVGCVAEVALPVPVLADLPAQHVARRHASGRPRARELNCFRRGRLVLIAALCTGQELPRGRLIPEPWPKSLDSVMQHPRVQIPLRKAA